jgi:hypothetical protein
MRPLSSAGSPKHCPSADEAFSGYYAIVIGRSIGLRQLMQPKWGSHKRVFTLLHLQG